MASSPSVPSTRQYRVGEAVRRALSDILARGDFDLPLISITQVDMTPDLRSARVYFMGGGDNLQLRDKLKQVRVPLQNALRPYLATRYLPRLKFCEDHTLNQVSLIHDLFADPRVARDLKGEDAEA
ncbi:MAG: ribosome-binding factor A [Alphaproteobacteria bacterium]